MLLQKLAEQLPSDPKTLFKRPMLLKALGYVSFQGVASKTIGALRAYDLLQKQHDGLSLSPVAGAILEAKTPEDRQKSALSPRSLR